MEKSWCGGPDGLGRFPLLLEGASGHLEKGGRIVVVVSSLMDGDALDRVLEPYPVKKIGSLHMFFEELSVLEIRVGGAGAPPGSE
ncbi:MAG: hypothetical protein IJ856_03880 [Candidatus Methanomethylophilaceae archaeon]|nr:hypothetical protein [Candidatus Methanomethylophilaceae archaeon]